MGANAFRGAAAAILSIGLMTAPFAQAQALEPATVTHTSASISGVRGDWSGDGTVDLIGTRSNGTLWMYEGTGTGAVRSGVQIGSGWTDFDWQGSPGDVDGDGHTDMLARRTNGTLWLYLGRGQGALGSGIQVGAGWSAMTAIITPGDFDLDRRPDLLARRSDGTVHLYRILATGDVRYVRMVGVGWNSMSSIIGMGDLNGDKRGDVIAVLQSDFPIRVGNELWLDGTLFSFLSNGTRLLSATKVGGGWNFMTQLTSPGDMNNDGRGDLIARRADGTLWLYAGRADGGVLPGRQVGSGWNGMLRIL